MQLARGEGTPILADVIRTRHDLMTEHVADTIEGAEMRLAARELLSRATNPEASDRLVRTLFGGAAVQSPTVVVEGVRTGRIPLNQIGKNIVDGVIDDDA